VSTDTEIKTAGLGNVRLRLCSSFSRLLYLANARVPQDSLAPPDLLVNGNMRVNWRTAWSYSEPNTPIAYVSESAQLRFPYTHETYNNPQALWTFAEGVFFG
jgi:hypothetical protein